MATANTSRDVTADEGRDRAADEGRDRAIDEGRDHAADEGGATAGKSGDVEVRGDVGRDVITGTKVIADIQQNFTLIFQAPFTPPPDLAALRADYLAYLRDSYSNLDIRGVRQVERVAPRIPLAAVYVPLKARAQHAGGDERWLTRVAGRPLPGPGMGEAVRGLVDPGSAEDLPIPRTGRIAPAGPVPVEVALRHEPAVVVLGDPGSGKSTLLKVIALALAEQSEGPLPIMLPLNAYARHLLKHGEVSLSDYFGHYYGTRQTKLTDAGALFQAALADRQAVVLLDGLDEVQAERAFVVRLVQDFVHEWMARPAEDESVVAGNRIVVTSRIVGYDEAPLAGRQWRSYYLSDFDRPDIERFVDQWTLAYEVGVHGGPTAVAVEAAERERAELLDSIFGRESVERLATNPLLLTILALIKRTGVALPGHRAKLYELYLEALIESWNLARSLDHRPVGPQLDYLETVQVLAPLALWLRETNSSAGLVSTDALEQWLADYYQQEWDLPKGEARSRGREFLAGVERYSNLLIERGERQYGFLHLTLEEMLAAKGVAAQAAASLDQAVDVFRRHLDDAPWRETLLLAVGALAIVNQNQAGAAKLLTTLVEGACAGSRRGADVILAGEALLDVGAVGVGRREAAKVVDALVRMMHDRACHIRERRDAGVLAGRLGWLPEAEADDIVLAPEDDERPACGLDACRSVGGVLIGKYPVTNYQFARFIAAGGYDERAWWSGDGDEGAEGWAWRMGSFDETAPSWLKDWLKQRPPAKRAQPFWWKDRIWNSPLQPVVGVSWFEAMAYCRWLENRLNAAASGRRYAVRLPVEREWEAEVGGRGEYAWGDGFDPARLNCADSWAERDLSDFDEWQKWRKSPEWEESSTTAVTTFPGGASRSGAWDGCGNVWEWMADQVGDDARTLRGGSWNFDRRDVRVSYRLDSDPGNYDDDVGFRIVVAPV